MGKKKLTEFVISTPVLPKTNAKGGSSGWRKIIAEENLDLREGRVTGMVHDLVNIRPFFSS